MPATPRRRPSVALLALLAASLTAAGCGTVDPPGWGAARAETPTAAAERAAAPASERVPANRGRPGPRREAGWRKVQAPASCRCSDGSPFHYWVRDGDPRKVVFFLAGGGACFSAETCAGATATYTVNLAGQGAPGAGGVFDLDHWRNPLAGYSMVYVPYCTGDLHLGTRVQDYGGGVQVRHTGYVNASTALAAAATRYPDAEEVVVAGSSAGSAGAPMYGGMARDVWPGAEIAVIADGSGSFPRDAGITLAIGGLWGVSDAIPPWPETADLPLESWSLPGLFANVARHDPGIRFATYNDAYDSVQAVFSALIGQDPSQLEAMIDANNAWIREQGVDVAHWVSPGSEHTILGSGRLYPESVDGTRFLNWLSAFLADRNVPDVHCTDCEAPG